MKLGFRDIIWDEAKTKKGGHIKGNEGGGST